LALPHVFENLAIIEEDFKADCFKMASGGEDHQMSSVSSSKVSKIVEDHQMSSVSNYVSKILGDPEETRKMLVQNIAANIFENLKKNSEMKDILKELLLTEDKKKRLGSAQSLVNFNFKVKLIKRNTKEILFISNLIQVCMQRPSFHKLSSLRLFRLLESI
jgi:hypothetical protein